MLPKTYSKTHDGQSKWIHFLIEEDDLLEKSNTIWDKLIRVLKKELTKWICFLIHDDDLLKSFDIKKEFYCKLVYNETALKTKIKSYGDEARDFYDKEIPRISSVYTCLAVINVNFAIKNDEDYYLEVHLKFVDIKIIF